MDHFDHIHTLSSIKNVHNYGQGLGEEGRLRLGSKRKSTK